MFRAETHTKTDTGKNVVDHCILCHLNVTLAISVIEIHVEHPICAEKFMQNVKEMNAEPHHVVSFKRALVLLKPDCVDAVECHGREGHQTEHGAIVLDASVILDVGTSLLKAIECVV